MEIFFKTCAEIFKYQKDTEYMIDNFYSFLEAISQCISEEVESIINEQMPGEIARELLKGEK